MAKPARYAIKSVANNKYLKWIETSNKLKFVAYEPSGLEMAFEFTKEQGSAGKVYYVIKVAASNCNKYCEAATGTYEIVPDLANYPDPGNRYARFQKEDHGEYITLVNEGSRKYSIRYSTEPDTDSFFAVGGQGTAGDARLQLEEFPEKQG